MHTTQPNVCDADGDYAKDDHLNGFNVSRKTASTDGFITFPHLCVDPVDHLERTYVMKFAHVRRILMPKSENFKIISIISIQAYICTGEQCQSRNKTMRTKEGETTTSETKYNQINDYLNKKIVLHTFF